MCQTPAGIKERTCLDYITGETIIFDSKLEKQYYDQVVIKGIKDGVITKYQLQKSYKLQPSFKYQGKTIREITYVSDFDIWYKDGSFIVVDVKGKATSDAKIKRKMVHYYYPDMNFVWMSYTKATGWVEYDELEKIRRQNKKNKQNKSEENNI